LALKLQVPYRASTTETVWQKLISGRLADFFTSFHEISSNFTKFHVSLNHKPLLERILHRNCRKNDASNFFSDISNAAGTLGAWDFLGFWLFGLWSFFPKYLI
jgi:hypothetical protein